LRRIDYIVIHHSASPLSTTLEDIDQWHRAKIPPWTGCGYHLVCESNGTMRKGRRIGRMGAHVRGWNRHSIGICLVGDNTFPGEGWTQPQIASLHEMLRSLRVLFPEAEVLGHRDLPKTATVCPGLDIRALLETANSDYKTKCVHGT
jgi:N-acetylmuramoyl-L-alanine amidase